MEMMRYIDSKNSVYMVLYMYNYIHIYSIYNYMQLIYHHEQMRIENERMRVTPSIHYDMKVSHFNHTSCFDVPTKCVALENIQLQLHTHVLQIFT